MPHDQLFKELLRAFFREFLELFLPDVAARLDFSRVEFLDKELFTDLPEGSRREADLVARVHTRDGHPELLLLHVELQARRERSFSGRMFEYYALLRLRHRLPVFPAVVYLAPGAGGLGEEVHTETLFDRDILTFRYASLGLPDLPAEDYLGTGNPLAAALSAVMRHPRGRRARQKAESLRETLGSALDEARKALLVNVIENYLPLEAADEEQFQSALGQEELREVTQMLTVYEERGILKGKRDVLLRQLRAKFGELPQAAVERVQSTEAETELDRLSERILTAGSLAEMGLTERDSSRRVRQVPSVYEFRAQRRALLKLLRTKFGDVPESVVVSVEAIDSEAELDRLLERFVTAGSLAEMGLTEN